MKKYFILIVVDFHDVMPEKIPSGDPVGRELLGMIAVGDNYALVGHGDLPEGDMSGFDHGGGGGLDTKPAVHSVRQPPR
jgi:hypothetical protein